MFGTDSQFPISSSRKCLAFAILAHQPTTIMNLSDDDHSMNPTLQRVQEIASKSLVPVGILFIAYIGARYWGEIQLAFKDFSRPIFVLSVAAGVLGNLGIALLFRSLLVKHNTPTKAQDAISLFYVSQITKYVPGKIWGILYQASRVKGMTGSIAILLSNIELMIIGIVTNLAVAIAILVFDTYPLVSYVAILVGICITFYVSRSNLLHIARKYLGKRLNVDNLNSIERSEFFTVDFAAFWLCSCIFVGANMAVLLAFFDFDTVSTLNLVGYLLLAWVVSVFAIVVPAGIGVREVVFLVIAGSASEYSTGLLATVAIVSRFWQVALDFSGAAIVLILRRFVWKL